MKRPSCLPAFILLVLLLAACAPEPTVVPVTDTPDPTPELIEPAPTHTPEVEEVKESEQVFEIAETKTTLLVYSGDARLSRDDGESWTLADTGLWLESGDRLQIGPGGRPGCRNVLYGDTTVMASS